jgi:hypothetical protein
MEPGDELFARFLKGGFEQLIYGEPAELADYLENRAGSTGLSAPLFLSQAVRAVYSLFLEHDEYGGTRIGFVRQIDDLVRERLPVIERSNPDLAGKLARDLRDEILKKANSYSPQNTYE